MHNFCIICDEPLLSKKPNTKYCDVCQTITPKQRKIKRVEKSPLSCAHCDSPPVTTYKGEPLCAFHLNPPITHEYQKDIADRIVRKYR